MKGGGGGGGGGAHPSAASLAISEQFVHVSESVLDFRSSEKFAGAC